MSRSEAAPLGVHKPPGHPARPQHVPPMGTQRCIFLLLQTLLCGGCFLAPSGHAIQSFSDTQLAPLPLSPPASPWLFTSVLLPSFQVLRQSSQKKKKKRQEGGWVKGPTSGGSQQQAAWDLWGCFSGTEGPRLRAEAETDRRGDFPFLAGKKSVNC